MDRISDIQLNLAIQQHEVPKLRAEVGWARRDQDFPRLFELCLFWAGMRDEHGELIAFGYMAGPGLEHGYIEDIIVHPNYQRSGIGEQLVRTLLLEAEKRDIGIVTVTYQEKHREFYERAGFEFCSDGVWRKSSDEYDT
ncbi:GNAT family N-acetyltransferase [Paenibacillus selenitireducens]|uniref:GNAT family N-acetyltransferase n=1 Tax=Paenibacillus selenitireducens TaxID=1324314 RepID=A0A1T2X1Y5_9BACL|nr:GNAT family N-acetyltransferase [Paenibacillus selenitireducens]OPA73726.1 GNAT family N-acetyltransferase [Paenibacillus selenitireducens]